MWGIQLAPDLVLGGHRGQALQVLDEAAAAFHKLGNTDGLSDVHTLRDRITL